MRLEDIYRLYLMMLEPVEIDPREVESFEEEESIKGEEKLISLPQVEPYPLVENLQEGQVIELAPSNDGLPLLFLVGEINREAGEAVLFPLSEFIELSTPHDVLVKVEGKPYIAQTDLYITVPAEGPVFRTVFADKTPLLVGQITPQELKEVKEVYRGQKGGVGSMAGGVKKLFKEREAQRYAPLQIQVLRELEALNELHSALKELERTSLALAADQRSNAGYTDDYRWEYDEKREILTLIPATKYLWSVARIIFKTNGKEINLWEGPLYPKMPFYIPKELFPGKLIEQMLRIVPLP